MDQMFYIPKQMRAEKRLIKTKRDLMKRGKIPSHKGGVGRFGRVAYDHTLYSPEELTVMERFWDRVIKPYRDQLLPERFRAPLNANRVQSIYGVNFGTNNGAYQRAWMRLGYRMFGVERVELIDELNAYGCEGITASYFQLQEIESSKFDFGVLDRAMFGVTPATDITQNDSPDGSYFGEMRRVIKPDGAMIGVLYADWTPAALSELAGLGLLTYWPATSQRNDVISAVMPKLRWLRPAAGMFNPLRLLAMPHPFLAFCVDFSEPPRPLPGLEAVVSKMPGRQANDNLAIDANFFVLSRKPDTIVALFIPTNEIVELSLKNEEWAIVSRVWWAERKDEFFRRPALYMMQSYSVRFGLLKRLAQLKLF